MWPFVADHATVWPVSVGKQIKRYRKHAELSQKALASALGVSQQTIADWEAGRAERQLRAMQILFRRLFDFEQLRKALRADTPSLSTSSPDDPSDDEGLD